MSPSHPGQGKGLAEVPNPFARDVVGSALDEVRADVPSINVHAKRECLRLIERVASQHESGSLLLFGEPGSGKTHLLSRLREHLERDAENGNLSVFIPLRMQTSAGMIWRFVRGNLAEALLRRHPGGRSVLERLLEGHQRDFEMVYHRDLGIILENLMQGVHVRDSAAWLHGYELPEPRSAALGLSAQPVDEEFQEERSYQVVKQLAQLAAPVPMVFCLDQVESLQRHTGDQEGIFALGKLVSTLHDTLPNAAIICCVQTAFIDSIKSAIRGAEQDRMLGNQANLHPLNWEQALEVLAARLQSQPELAALRPANAPALWPLDASELKPLFERDGACVARKLLHRARELFDAPTVKTRELPEPLDQFFQRVFSERTRPKPASESDAIIRDALPQLFHALGMQPKGLGTPRVGGFDLVVEHDGRPAAFALCNQRPGVGLVSRFRKLGDRWDSVLTPRLVLLRDSRLGIGTASKASHQKLDDLRSRRAVLVSVSPDALAELDALRSLLADAGSGDLSCNGEAVTRGSVEEWIAAHLPAPLADLIDDMKGKSMGVASNLFPALTAFLQDRKIVTIEDAARELQVTIQEVADCAHQNSEQFAVIGGRSPILFHPVRQPIAG